MSEVAWTILWLVLGMIVANLIWTFIIMAESDTLIMARSKRIYILLDESEPEPTAAFTVKHECVTHLTKMVDDGIPDELMLWSIPDGGHRGETIRQQASEWLEEQE